MAGHKHNPTICVDFDGVVHGYSQGWKGAENIYDPPVPGAAEAIKTMRSWGARVVIFSTRASTNEGTLAMWAWLKKYGIEVDGLSHEKPMAVIYIDDRALRFEGKWEETIKTIVMHEAAGFKTWQKE